MPGRFEPPLSRLDLLLAHPFLITMREGLAAPMSATHAAAPSPPATFRWRRQAGAGLRFVYRALQQSFAALHCASEPAQSEDELETVLMFSLTGLALSLYLAAKIHMVGADDGLTDILLLLS
jgi:hypothetical protein